MADYHIDLIEVIGSGTMTLRCIRVRVFETETLDWNINSQLYEKYIDVAAFTEKVEFEILNIHLSVANKNQLWNWSVPPKTRLVLHFHSAEGPYINLAGYLGIIPADVIQGEFSRPGPFTFTFYPD